MKNDSPALTQEILEIVLKKTLGELKTTLEGKIEDSRVDAREHLQAVARGLNHRIDGVEKRIDGVEGKVDGLGTKMDRVETRLNRVESELKFTQLAVREVKRDTVELSKRMNSLDKNMSQLNAKFDTQNETILRHDHDIEVLKVTVG